MIIQKRFDQKEREEGNPMLKKLAVAAMLLGGLMIWAGKSWAATTDTIVLKVTPVGTKSVNIVETQYDFGPLNLATNDNLSVSSVTVQNNGTIPTTYGLQISVADGTWLDGAAVGADPYHLQAIFH